MKNYMSEKIMDSSAAAGSETKVPAGGAAGETPTTTAAGEKSADYSELEKAFGRQGQELGEYREFVKQITPLLTELDSNPKLVQAILNKKIDVTLAEGILDGKVSIGEAEQVAQAHQKVKEDMGAKAYKAATPEEVQARVETTLREEMNRRFSEIQEQDEYKAGVNEFIDSTPDFKDYADKIVIWLNEHPDQDDIQVAYEAVKGKVLEREFAKANQAGAGEAAKQVASNTGGGNSPASGQIANDDLWDKLVSKKANPNVL
jgi:hypothetical protein